MTIAVSSAVKPSKLLIAAVAAMGLTTAAAAGMAVSARFGVPLFPSQAWTIAGAALFACLGVLWFARSRKAWHIDISGIGQIRVRDAAALQIGAAIPAVSRADAQRVRLLPDSTLWPSLLLLRMQTDEGRVIVLPILPDSVSVDDFRALSVALRWIASQARDERGKIL